jgi:hypothetical protein
MVVPMLESVADAAHSMHGHAGPAFTSFVDLGLTPTKGGNYDGGLQIV